MLRNGTHPTSIDLPANEGMSLPFSVIRSGGSSLPSEPNPYSGFERARPSSVSTQVVRRPSSTSDTIERCRSVAPGLAQEGSTSANRRASPDDGPIRTTVDSRSVDDCQRYQLRRAVKRLGRFFPVRTERGRDGWTSARRAWTNVRKSGASDLESTSTCAKPSTSSILRRFTSESVLTRSETDPLRIVVLPLPASQIVSVPWRWS